MRCETSNCVGAARLLSLSNVSERLRIHLRLRLWVRAMASTASAAATKFSCRPAGRSLEIRIAYLDSAARCLPVACGRSGAKPGARPSLAAGFSRELDNCRCASGCRYNGGAAVADLLRASERAKACRSEQAQLPLRQFICKHEQASQASSGGEFKSQRLANGRTDGLRLQRGKLLPLLHLLRLLLGLDEAPASAHKVCRCRPQTSTAAPASSNH